MVIQAMLVIEAMVEMQPSVAFAFVNVQWGQLISLTKKTHLDSLLLRCPPQFAPFDPKLRWNFAVPMNSKRAVSEGHPQIFSNLSGVGAVPQKFPLLSLSMGGSGHRTNVNLE